MPAEFPSPAFSWSSGWREDSTTYWVVDSFSRVLPDATSREVKQEIWRVLKSVHVTTGEVKEESLGLLRVVSEGDAIDNHAPYETPAAWSEDGRVWAWYKQDGTGQFLLIKDWRTGRIHAIANWDTIVTPLSQPVGRSSLFRLSRDGNTLMTFRDGDILLWDVSPFEVASR
jgi:hypothetical protein